MSGKSEEAGRQSAPAWDPVVRLTHWCIALAVVLNGLIVEDESLIHIWIGYAAIAFLVLRLLWGVIGTEEARFTSFPPSLAGAKEHLSDLLTGRRRPHRSHNPLGALMVYALWGTLIVVAVTGVMMESDPFPATGGGLGDGFMAIFREYERASGGSEFLEEIHEAAANMLLFLAVVHVGGVLMESWLTGVNLVRAMVKGGKRMQDGG
ncbi:cytochrome b/b6 domain-containing protein [Thalassospiraceae bacterium LMO-SO8]|nr:cytochrome b/b6 domain-containing protein [Alphaproteobacteria bacterium LMO-S08]WND74322.1 cytochrome b/b6 domain-containing protein [Thalassospiraceae bacterium LMO-SO8]